MDRKRAARHRCNDDRAKNVRSNEDVNIVPRDYELGTLLFGLLFAFAIGLCMVWEVVA